MKKECWNKNLSDFVITEKTRNYSEKKLLLFLEE